MVGEPFQSRRDEAIALLERGLALWQDAASDPPETPAHELELFDRLTSAGDRLTVQVAVTAADVDRRRVSETVTGLPLSSRMMSKNHATKGQAFKVMFTGHALEAHPEVKDAVVTGTVSKDQAVVITGMLDALPPASPWSKTVPQARSWSRKQRRTTAPNYANWLPRPSMLPIPPKPVPMLWCGKQPAWKHNENALLVDAGFGIATKTDPCTSTARSPLSMAQNWCGWLRGRSQPIDATTAPPADPVSRCHRSSGQQTRSRRSAPDPAAARLLVIARGWW